MKNTREIYDSAAFGDWSTYTQLETHEAFLATSFLDPSKPTLDAGTGGGRIVLGLRQRGFKDLTAFDFVPRFLEEVRQKDPGRAIRLSAQDATKLAYENESFDQILYLAQLVCLVGAQDARRRALSEAYRVLRPRGVGVFSFLCHEVRSQSATHRLYLAWLAALRTVTRPDRNMQTLPWLRIGGKFHRGALLDLGPHVYWYKAHEAVNDLENAGLKVKAVATLKQLQENRVVRSVEELMREPLTGHFYCICSK